LSADAQRTKTVTKKERLISMCRVNSKTARSSKNVSRRYVWVSIAGLITFVSGKKIGILSDVHARPLNKAEKKTSLPRDMRKRLILAAPPFVTGVAWSQDGSRIAAIGNYGRKIFVWTNNGDPVQTITCNVTIGPYVGNAISFLSNDIVLTPAYDVASVFSGEAFTLWDISRGEVLRHVMGPAPRQIDGKNQARIFVRFNEGHNIAVYSGAPDWPIMIYSTHDWRITERISWQTGLQRQSANCLDVSPNGKMIAIGLDNGSILLFETQAPNTFLGTLVVYPSGLNTPFPLEIGVESLAFSPDGRFLAIGASGSIGPSVINGGSKEVESFAASLAHAPIQIWNVADWKLIAAYPGHLAPVEQMSWTSDSSLLAAAAGDGTVRLFSPNVPVNPVASGRQYSNVYSVAFSPLGDALAAAADDSITIYTI
jgi:WD40 repeat protein